MRLAGSGVGRPMKALGKVIRGLGNLAKCWKLLEWDYEGETIEKT